MKNPVGERGEQIAAEYLVKKGYQILDRNWRIRGGEIDIVAILKNTIIFVEVKTRSSNAFGTPAEAVGYHKLEFLKRAALFYLQAHPNLHSSYQIDVVSVLLGNTQKIEHLQSVTS